MSIHNILRNIAAFALAVSLFSISSLSSAAGLLTPKNSGLPTLDIKEHNVSVIVQDGYAITQVDQVFHNPHQQDLEAVYSFPVPEQGIVSEFTLWIDGKPVTGEVLKKQQAREIYQQEKAAGRSTGLTEKDSYKTFDISVSPVRAGQDTKIRLVYMQATHVDTGIGRYLYPLEEGGVDEEKMAFWTGNDKVTNQFNFDFKLRNAYPVAALRMPNQAQAMIQKLNDNEWTASIQHGANAEEGSPQPQQSQVYQLNKDLVVYWRLQDGLPGSVDMVTYKPEKDKRGTYMITLTPGDDLQAITEGKDWVFVLDISGSMKGKYQTLADGVQKALGKMRPEDRFRIILFNSRAQELTNGYINATQQSVTEYSNKVANVQPSDGTNLFDGVQLGLNSLDADRTSGIVLVTDGVANVGETREKALLELIQKKDVRLFSFIMGNSANRPLLKNVAKASDGFAVSISNSDDIVGQIMTATNKLTHQALHGVKVKIKGVKTADQTPEQIASLYRGDQLILMGHYWGEGDASLELTGKISGQSKSYSTNFHFPAVSNEHPEIERMWAYAAIEDMRDEMQAFGEKADLKQAVTDIALEYSLVTDYTSMLIVEEEQFKHYNIQRNNQQRVAVEKQAQMQRQSAPVQSRRVDSHQPMYPHSRPSFGGGSGGGAVDPLTLLMLLAVFGLLYFNRSTKEATV